MLPRPQETGGPKIAGEDINCDPEITGIPRGRGRSRKDTSRLCCLRFSWNLQGRSGFGFGRLGLLCNRWHAVGDLHALLEVPDALRVRRRRALALGHGLLLLEEQRGELVHVPQDLARRGAAQDYARVLLEVTLDGALYSMVYCIMVHQFMARHI